jgi:hypothetical protein
MSSATPQVGRDTEGKTSLIIGTNRAIGSAAAPGLAGLSAWQAGWLRNAPPIQVFFAEQLSDEEILAKFEGLAPQMRTILEQYERLPSQIGPFEQEVPSAREPFWRLTVDNGIRNMRANLVWAGSVIRDIKAGRVPSSWVRSPREDRRSSV